MSRSGLQRALCAVGTLVLAASCAGGGSSGKGEEEAFPTDGSFDSFRSPTEHGPIAFGIPSQAAFTDEEHFHSWTFVLDAEAEVDLSTLIGSSNIDTVMYLYARSGETESWGSYIARNDDDGDALASRIRRVLQAGQYRILVKAHKLAIRGRFEVLAVCEGEGCAATGIECDPEDPEPLPAATRFTASCARRLRTVFDSGVIHRDEYGIDYSEMCRVSDETERRAIGMYRSYWDDIMGWDDFVYEPEEGVAIEVESMALDGRLTGGTVVGVDLSGADESAIDFVFDLDGNLLMLYQHNQSPDINWFCGDAGEPALEVPDEDCVSAYIGSMPHDEDEVGGEDHDGSIAELVEALGGTTAMALETYAASLGVGNDTHVEVEVLSWESIDWGQGGQVIVASEGQPTMVYDVTSGEYRDDGVVMEANVETGEVRFVCAGL